MLILNILFPISIFCQGQYILEYMHSINSTQGLNNITFACGLDRIHKFSFFIQDSSKQVFEVMYQNRTIQTQSHFKLYDHCIKNIIINCISVYCDFQVQQKTLIMNHKKQQYQFENEYYKYHYLQIQERTVLVVYVRHYNSIQYCELKMYRSQQQDFDIYDYQEESKISKFGESFTILEPGNHKILLKGCPQQQYEFILDDSSQIQGVLTHYFIFPEDIKFFDLYKKKYGLSKDFQLDLIQGSIKLLYYDKLIDLDFRKTYYIYDLEFGNIEFCFQEKQTIIKWSQIELNFYFDVIVLTFNANFCNSIKYENKLKSFNFQGNCMKALQNFPSEDIQSIIKYYQDIQDLSQLSLQRNTEIDQVCEFIIEILQISVEFNNFITKFVKVSNSSKVSISINPALLEKTIILEINDITGNTYFTENQKKILEVSYLYDIEIIMTQLFSVFSLTLTQRNPIKFELISTNQMIVRNSSLNYFKIIPSDLTARFQTISISQNNRLNLTFYSDNCLIKTMEQKTSYLEQLEIYIKAESESSPNSLIFSEQFYKTSRYFQVTISDITIFKSQYPNIQLILVALGKNQIVHYYTSNEYIFIDDIQFKEFKILPDQHIIDFYITISNPSWIIMIKENDLGQIQLNSNEYQLVNDGLYYYYLNQSQVFITSTCLNMNTYINVIPLAQEFNTIIYENMYPNELQYNLHYFSENQNLIYMNLQQYLCQYYVCLLRIRNQNQCLKNSISLSQKYILKSQQLYISQLQTQFELLIEYPLHQYEAYQYMCIISTLFGTINNVQVSKINNLYFNQYGATLTVSNNQSCKKYQKMIVTIVCFEKCIIQVNCHQQDLPIILQTGYVYFFQLSNQSIEIENQNLKNYNYDLLVGEIDIVQNNGNIIINSESLSLFNFYFENNQILINANVKLSIFQNIEIKVVGPQNSIFIETDSLSQLMDQNQTFEYEEYLEYNYSLSTQQSIKLQTNNSQISLNPLLLRMKQINEIHYLNDKQIVELIGLIQNEYYIFNSNRDYRIFNSKNELILPLQSIYNGKYIKEYIFDSQTAYILSNSSNDSFKILLFSNKYIHLLQNTTITMLNIRNNYYFQNHQHQYGIMIIQSEKYFNLLFEDLVTQARYFHISFDQKKVKQFSTEALSNDEPNTIQIYTYYIKDIELYENCFKYENYQIEYLKQKNQQLLVQISSISPCQISRMIIVIQQNNQISHNFMKTSGQSFTTTLENVKNTVDFILQTTLRVENNTITLQFDNHYQGVELIDSNNFIILQIAFMIALILIVILIKVFCIQKQNQQLQFTQQVDEAEVVMHQKNDDKETNVNEIS